ncbi:MAG: translation initiation factor IF-5A [Candidatus Jordarchaeum sp.]|uniref:translation initiation factor IF-5A n=1 Tax=Candidatus Jordarchaeum sp. TaxID=2823881 RepID=UPI00404B59EB
MSKKITEVSKLKTGSYLLIDDEPYKVVSTATSKSGKHGHAKVRLVAMGVFDESKKDLVFPGDAKVEVPLIDKRNGQVISVSDNIMLMDLETYETFEIPKPKEEDVLSKLAEGAEVEYWSVMNKKKIMRVKS